MEHVLQKILALAFYGYWRINFAIFFFTINKSHSWFPLYYIKKVRNVSGGFFNKNDPTNTNQQYKVNLGLIFLKRRRAEKCSLKRKFVRICLPPNLTYDLLLIIWVDLSVSESSGIGVNKTKGKQVSGKAHILNQ